MNKIIKKIIIWFFKKYAFDYWTDLQIERGNQELLKKYKTDDIEEAYQYSIDETQEPMREAYEAGSQDGYERGIKENCRNY